MEFQEINEKEYRSFWENHPLKSFLSSPEIAKLREESNWKAHYVGVRENQKLIAAAMLLSHERHLGKREFYSPRGYLMDFENLDLLAFFTKEVKKYVKNQGGYVLRMDPYLLYKQRDIDGNVVEGGEDHSRVVEKLLSLKYRRVPTPLMEQVGWMFCLDLKDKTEEEILKEMKPNVRNIIHKTEKFGIVVRELSYDELEEFQSIMEETSKRKGFSNRKLSYYQKMYELFSKQGEVKFFITELNIKDYRDKLLDEKSEKEEKKNHLGEAKYNDAARANLEKEIASLEKRIQEAEQILSEKGTDVITLSGSMFMLIQPEVIYLSSGNYEEYMKFNSQYLIQWKLIQYGIQHEFQRHNFYGIPENINTHPKDYGIYEFKRGFNGYVEELIGEFELPISWHYTLFSLLHRLKRK
ncbi:MAG: peptidoglycan bridge formation glycyltransferase FemA/FemB family protein [Bacilli bacterium]|nr:peptidoglycan bridge formation glycyltransferase FemA/FemB family protein [Bacilli bacterium]